MKVQMKPNMLTTPNTSNEFLTPIPAWYPASVLLGSWFCAKYKNPNEPTMAPSFPDAEDIPWQVDLNLAGNISAGTTNVVALGPKFAKKKVRE